MEAKNDVTEAAKKRSEALAGAGEAYAGAISNANTAYQGAIDTANAAYQENVGKNVSDTETEVTKANQDFASIVQGYKDELDKAKLEDQKQQEIDQKTVAWTGATELAAAIANMVGVGSFGASNQQHHSFSQDWMKKADADAKLRQQRIDNIRDRQRAMEQQAINLRLQGLNALNRVRGDAASAAYKGALGSAEAAYKGALDSAGAVYKTANAVAESDYSGAQQAATIGLQEQAKNISAAAQRRSQELQEFAHGAKRDENGKLVADPTSPYYIKNTGAGSGSGSGKNNYSVTINGRNYKLRMNDDTFNRALKDGKAELRQDLVEMLGVDSWETLASDAAQKKDKKKKFLEYAPIIEALSSNSGYAAGADKNDVIDNFVQLHRSELNHFNAHLLSVADGVADIGAATQASNTPAASAPAQKPAAQTPAGEEEDTRYNEFK